MTQSRQPKERAHDTYARTPFERQPRCCRERRFAQTRERRGAGSVPECSVSLVALRQSRSTSSFDATTPVMRQQESTPAGCMQQDALTLAAWSSIPQRFVLPSSSR